MRPEWKDFVGGKWENEVNVRDFIQKNYHPYEGDEHRTQKIYGTWYLIYRKKNVKQAAFSIWTPKWFPPLHPMARAIWTRAKKRLSASRQTHLSNVPYSLTAVSVWQKRLALTTATK